MNRKILIAAAALAILGAALWWQLGGQHTAEAASDDVPAEFADVDTSGIVEMTMGPEDAAVTVTEYASLTCPHCADFHKTTFQELKRDFIDTGKIRYVYRDVFFDGAGLRGSLLARCAGPTRFFGINDLLYTRQAEWLDAKTMGDVMDNLRTIGKVAGLSDDQITACLEDQDKAQVLEAWFRQHAAEDGITSTPTVLVDGQAYGNPPYDDLKAVLDEKLNQ
ncbi:thiol-disulfide oxidoreductase [Pelagivirga sediminicola]|uniref:Thiol-disulfide oxidoreductase n=1 Tax=Pelagivirga sediminicola TaxID=2170575 RepID=A0A2T7G6P3_9RHOB|nr:DsbA family protein [Pelagivirga sediminicola]PVA10057.1 thiol-disulfide oxidoreductase [Pelagivirga sediminicola]